MTTEREGSRQMYHAPLSSSEMQVRRHVRLLSVVTAVTLVTAWVVAWGGGTWSTANTSFTARPLEGPVVGREPAHIQSKATTPPPRATPLPPPPPGNVLVVGDSIAEFTARYLAEVAPARGSSIMDGGVWGCGVVEGGPLRYVGAEMAQPPACDGWANRWGWIVAASRPSVVLLMVGRWEVMDRVVGGGWTHIGEPGYDGYLRAQLDRAVAVLSSTGARVALTTSPYFLRKLRPDGGLFPEDEPARVDRFNQIVGDVAAAHPGVVTLIDFGGRVTPGGRYTADVDGIHVRRDGVHLTEAGERWLAPWLLDATLRSATPPPPAPPVAPAP